MKINNSNNKVEKNIVKSLLTAEKYKEYQRNKKNIQLIFKIIRVLLKQNYL